MKSITFLILLLATCSFADDDIAIRRNEHAKKWITFQYSFRTTANVVVVVQPGIATAIHHAFVGAASTPSPEFGPRAFKIGDVTCVPLKEWSHYTNTHHVVLTKTSVTFYR